MASYEFPLSKILKYRKLEYRKVLAELAPVFTKWAEISLHLKDLESKRNSLQLGESSRVNFEELVRKERYSQHLFLLKQQIKIEQETWRFPYIKAKEKALKAFQAVDLLEKLAKSSIEAYKRRVKKKEKNLLDDMLVVWYCNRGGG